MRLIFVTQVLDEADPALGFVPAQLRALSNRVDELVVIANEVRQVPEGLSAEVVSLGKERGLGKLARTVCYRRELSRLLGGSEPAAVFAHMCPIYLILAAPTARRAGSRTLLWFTHGHDSPKLRLAEALSSAVLTAVPASYPHFGPKVTATGHAIDVARYDVTDPAEGSLRLLCLGRLSRLKGLDVALQAVAATRAAGCPVSLRIVGPTRTADERAHREELVHLAEQLALTPHVSFEAGVSHDQIPRLLQECSVLLNPTTPGSADKVVLESMAAGRPPLTTHGGFSDLLADLPMTLTFPDGDAAALSDRIIALSLAQPADLAELARELRARVSREHSLDHWAERVVQIAFDETTGALPVQAASRWHTG